MCLTYVLIDGNFIFIFLIPKALFHTLFVISQTFPACCPTSSVSRIKPTTSQLQCGRFKKKIELKGKMEQ